MKNLTRRFVKNESGATAIEYGLIALLIGVALVTAMTTLKGKISDAYVAVGTALTPATK